MHTLTLVFVRLMPVRWVRLSQIPQFRTRARDCQVKKTIVPFVTTVCMAWPRPALYSVRNAVMQCTRNVLLNVRPFPPVRRYAIINIVVGRKTAQNKGNDLTCVYCRARWVAPAPPSSGAAQRKQGGYLNLANVAGLSTARDTSTCTAHILSAISLLTSWLDYHGPQSGHRYYGYNTYNDDLS